MTVYNVSVAENVCGEQPPTIPVNIDCSLCAIGFPQVGGMIGINFYGPRCQAGYDPSPSYWLGYETKWANFACPDPGENAEPDPNTWVASALFAGLEKDGCANQYKFVATLTAISHTQITVSVQVYVLLPTVGGNTWTPYISWSETLTEVVNTDTTAYRGRAFRSPDFVPVTPDPAGGTGDPVSFVKMTVGMTSMRIGCGSTGNAVPVCGFWDGSQWLTCLRGVIRSNTDDSKREFTQFGFNLNPCGGTSEPWCNCDTIKLTSVSPPQAISPAGGTTYNNDPAFVTKYGVIGVPGEAVGADQQIQVSGGSTYGIEVVVKQINGGSIYICTNDNGAGWVCTVATVAQAKGPHILTATRTGFDVWLYALNFPNDNLLATECSDGGGYPTPDPETDPWWCTVEGCVQSALQPSGAIAGPYTTALLCGEACATIDPPNPSPEGDPWWCVDNSNCVQSPTALPDSTGPFASTFDCEAACPEGETEPGFYCVYVDGSWQCLYYPDRPAGHTGLWYYSFSACISSCNTAWPPPPVPDPDPVYQYYCVNIGSGIYECQLATSPPAGTAGGPYATSAECETACDGLSELQYWCVMAADFSLGCAASMTAPPSTVGGPYGTLSACEAVCSGSVIPEQSAPAIGATMEVSMPLKVTKPASVVSSNFLAGLTDQPKIQPQRREVVTETVSRIRGECKYLGGFLEDPASCGCNKTSLLRECQIYGKCRIAGRLPREAEEGIGCCTQGCKEFVRKEA